MEWLELIVSTNTLYSDTVSQLFTQCGAEGTMIEDRADIPDPDNPHGYWEIIDPALIASMPEDVLVHAWLAADSQLPDRLSALESALKEMRRQAGDSAGKLEMTRRQARDEDWNEIWKQYYKPFRAGTSLVVKPTWEAYEPKDGDLIIEMDPGMAFGSGTHETTSMCLALLEKAVRSGDTVIDVGTGSGILAIGAARLGASRVLAVDIDEDAVRVARENIRHNGLEDRIEARCGDLLSGEPEALCQVCVANIIADVIVSFAAPLRAHIRENGFFVASGIIRERTEEVRRALLEAGYVILEEMHRGEWTAFLSRR